jgi:DNA-binding MarR family transcriptional regulator
MARLENLLGAQALALADRLVSGAAGPSMASSECAAMVTLLAHPGRTVGWLGDVLGLTSSGVTRLVERLVTAGWVVRSAGVDGRRRQLDLTPAGADVAKVVLANRQAALGRAVGVLSAPERDQLEALLEKMVAGLADDRTAAFRLCRLCDRAACYDVDRECPLQHTMADG